MRISPAPHARSLLFFVDVAYVRGSVILRHADDRPHRLSARRGDWRSVIYDCLLIWPPYVIGQAIIFLPCGFFFYLSSFFLAYSQPSQIGCLPYFHTWCGCGLSANLGCRSETCCTQLAENTGCKNSPSGHHRTTLLGYIFAIKARIENRGKNLLSSNVSPACPHNMVNFGPLAAEIGSVVWGTPPNVNGSRVLAVLLHGTLVVGISQTLQCWTEGAIFSRAAITLGIGPHSSLFFV